MNLTINYKLNQMRIVKTIKVTLLCGFSLSVNAQYTSTSTLVDLTSAPTYKSIASSHAQANWLNEIPMLTQLMSMADVIKDEHNSLNSIHPSFYFQQNYLQNFFDKGTQFIQFHYPLSPVKGLKNNTEYNVARNTLARITYQSKLKQKKNLFEQNFDHELKIDESTRIKFIVEDIVDIFKLTLSKSTFLNEE